jgi:hypothetical protein
MSVIRLATGMPSSGSRAVIERRQRAVPRGVPLAAPIAVVDEGNVLETAFQEATAG